MAVNHDEGLTHLLTSPVSRRAALRSVGGAGIATALGIAAYRGAGAAEAAVSATPIEPNAGSWQTWVLKSGDQLRLPPPDDAAAAGELAELEALAAGRDAAARDRIAYWDAGAPAYRWNELAIQHLQSNGIGGPRAARAMALLNVAIADATIAAWDSKYAHNRPRPAEVRPALPTVIRLRPALPTRPSTP